MNFNQGCYSQGHNARMSWITIEQLRTTTRASSYIHVRYIQCVCVTLRLASPILLPPVRYTPFITCSVVIPLFPLI